MPPMKQETAAESEKREKEARDVAEQIKARRRSNSRDVKMKDKGRSSTGRTISNLLGLGSLFQSGSANAIADAPAGALQGIQAQQEGHQMVAYERQGLKISFLCCKEADGSSKITATFNNSLDMPMTNFLFEVAVPKCFRLDLQPATGQVLLPNTDSLSQTMFVVNESNGEKGLQMRLRIRYSYNGKGVEETEQVSNFPRGY
mmetsp:Transcript_108642/g.232075  ORF Transcript_108642/g.232075 Transcript_108642/m.232075 type:complete len:202 (-) Transcript_108642:153-758(-)